ncbi:MAG: helix-turn-helix transcriptional regulator [Bdellovibrionales bacterium]|nr:helix-turn-helix transcriptional regulator [Bdellovibrionales bacterium]MBT3525556.1 helix-turn-helix transcriptional regulator [Bdellovibrionales bacterium]MBT7668085.1 helix-turn-helix transcriptional regulator [Bdellovibrionales bacterium]
MDSAHERNVTLSERTIASNLAHNIINLRNSRGLTQQKLAKVASIPRSTITHFESGSGNPSLSNLIKLATALEVQVEELLSPVVPTVTMIKSFELPHKDKNGCLVYNLLPSPLRGLGLEKMEFEPDHGFTGVPHLKGTTEYFACVKGKTQVVVCEETFVLSQGDVLIFSGDDNHSYKNVGNTKAIAISVLVHQRINEE